MPSHLHRTGRLVCWNCEHPASTAVGVALRAPSGAATAITLCEECYVSAYLPFAAEAEVAPGSAPGRTVLVVDDDPDIRSFLRHAFEEEGYAVDTAGNGLEALQKACRRTPDVVVLDLRMPVMDGRTFIAAWRQVTSVAAVPIVAISAHERQPRAEELGVATFLSKPFDLGALIGTVDSLLEAVA